MSSPDISLSNSEVEKMIQHYTPLQCGDYIRIRLYKLTITRHILGLYFANRYTLIL